MLYDLDIEGDAGTRTALSLGERVTRDGALSSRRGSGEGFLMFASQPVRP
jgi:hypothetical protein